MKKNNYKLPCNIAQTLNIIGDKWTLLIIHEIMIGKNTFKELENSLSGIATNLLTNRLKDLIENDIIEIEKYSNHPVRYKYIMTQKGKDLQDVFNAIIIWGKNYLEKCYKKLISVETNEEVEIRYFIKNENKVLTREEVKVEDL